MELRKSYKGFIIWMILFTLLCFCVPLLPIEDGNVLGRIINNCMTISLALLAFIIYKTEYVYWYNGTTYEEAVDAGEERRKVFAWKHFKRFGMFAGVFLVFSIVAHMSGIGLWNDIVIVTVGIVGIAISTVNIKL